MFPRYRTPVIALLCALALFATACGGSASDASVASGASQDSATTTDAAESGESAPAAQQSASDESPLADLLGIPFNDGDAADEYFEDLGRQAEIKIAECMLAQGFEYQVVDYSQLDGFSDTIDFDTREFAEEYGFGIASNPFEESFEAFEAFQDPNQEYRESLTEGEQEAYETALNGVFPDNPDDFENFEPGGCQGEAFEEVFSFGLVFEQFGDQFEEIEQAYEADPRIVGATAGWSSCMSEAGHSFSDVDGAEDDIRRRYNAIVNSPGAFADDGPDESGAVVIEEGGDVEEFVFGPQTLNPEFQARVDELAVEERAIAVASWDCNAPLREIEEEVRIEYEQRFVDENGAAIREALGE